MELKLLNDCFCKGRRYAFNRTIVELKLRQWWHSLDRQHLPFNRTIVELKRAFGRVIPSGILTFNRTIVELKLFVLPFYLRLPGQLLIEPLWNWNAAVWNLPGVIHGLLIAPLWNWNSKDIGIASPSTLAFNRTIVELKLRLQVQPLVSSKTFNRTIVELKRYSPFAFSFLGGRLLIAPLWNWNLLESLTPLVKPHF